MGVDWARFGCGARVRSWGVFLGVIRAGVFGVIGWGVVLCLGSGCFGMAVVAHIPRAGSGLFGGIIVWCEVSCDWLFFVCDWRKRFLVAGVGVGRGAIGRVLFRLTGVARMSARGAFWRAFLVVDCFGALDDWLGRAVSWRVRFLGA